MEDVYGSENIMFIVVNLQLKLRNKNLLKIKYIASFHST